LTKIKKFANLFLPEHSTDPNGIKKETRPMKKTLFVALAIALMIGTIAPNAAAKEASNAEKGIGNFLCAPFRIIATPVVAVGKLVQGKPAAMLTIPRDIRRETFDMVESAVRVPFAPPIDKDGGELGTVNAGIAEANLDWLVDAAIYGSAAGVINWNSGGEAMTQTLLEQSWVTGGAVAVGVGLMDVGGAALEQSE